MNQNRRLNPAAVNESYSPIKPIEAKCIDKGN